MKDVTSYFFIKKVLDIVIQFDEIEIEKIC